MTKNDLQQLIVECLQECAAEHTPTPVKENSMTLKKSELKALVNEVVRQCVKEAGPQYKVRGKKSQLEQPGQRNKAREIQSDPEINEVSPPGGEKVVKAIKKSGSAVNPWAVAWSMKNKGEIENEQYEESPGAEHEGGENEQEEIRLLKAMGQAIIALLKMHQGMEEPEGGEEAPEDDGVPFKGVPEKGEGEAESPEISDEPESPAEKEKEEEPVDENFRVQARSAKTVKDYPGNPDPKGKRDPEMPTP